MFLWAREVQSLPEAREVHEVQGNQEHQQYQENPAERETRHHYSQKHQKVRMIRVFQTLHGIPEPPQDHEHPRAREAWSSRGADGALQRGRQSVRRGHGDPSGPKKNNTLKCYC
ncbi:hypothetical protein EYF80_007561 [Liparis tanakae]|uniref:Uncharacterized protein n=1 Tax=Liparis tanakae TaxID=230148 RepID=A0A4Z2IY66_9TELE|nr:hypothetical protein EYF80_007561 [Liparis tanakae]